MLLNVLLKFFVYIQQYKISKHKQKKIALKPCEKKPLTSLYVRINVLKNVHGVKDTEK